MVLQGWSVSDSDLGSGHRHCLMCFNTKKCGAGRDHDVTQWCPLTRCDQCGAEYHQCKEAEHLETMCPQARVQCLNREYGCNADMLRSDIVAHLPVCPANVVTCSQEWNRWPLHCKERWKTVPFRSRNPRAESGQLDYELAVR